MLANNARQSVGNDYPYASGDWVNNKCWHFMKGSYILQENLEYEQLIPATDYTIGGWFKLIHDGSNDSGDENERIYSTIYTMLNGDSTSHMSMMYGSMYSRKISSSQMEIGTVDEESSPFSYLPLSTNNYDGNPNTLNQWIFLAIRVKTSASDDNVAWFLNGIHKVNTTKSYVQNPDEGNYAIKIGGEDEQFYVSELGVWKDNLPAVAIASLYNNGTPVSFQENIGSYGTPERETLVAYYRFGDGTGDNPASFLHDETNTDNGSTATDLNSMIGEIHQVPIQNAG